MVNPSKFYLSHMHTQTKYRATWDPTKQLKIGYIGKLENGVLNIYSSLGKEGIAIESSVEENGSSMDYTSHDSVSITAKISGTAPAAGSVLSETDAGFSFEFSGDNSIVFQTGNHRTHQLINLAEIEEAILEKYREGNWAKDWVIVTEVIEVDAATIIISNSSNGRLELKASASIGLNKMTLTDAALNLSVAREQGSTLKYIAQNGLTPLYRVMGLRSPWLGNTHLTTKGVAKKQGLDKRLILLEHDESWNQTLA